VPLGFQYTVSVNNPLFSILGGKAMQSWGIMHLRLEEHYHIFNRGAPFGFSKPSLSLQRTNGGIDGAPSRA